MTDQQLIIAEKIFDILKRSKGFADLGDIKYDLNKLKYDQRDIHMAITQLNEKGLTIHSWIKRSSAEVYR